MKNSGKMAWILLAAVFCAAPALAPVPVLAQKAGQEGAVPSIVVIDPALAIVAPRWGAGIRNMQVDIVYSGDNRSARCDYQMYDAAGEPVGVPGSAVVRAQTRTTLTIVNVGEEVASIHFSLG